MHKDKPEFKSDPSVDEVWYYQEFLPPNQGKMFVQEIVRTVGKDAVRENICCICGSPHDLRQCSRCKTVSYCSKKCQTIDWKINGHKLNCSLEGKWRARRTRLRFAVGDHVECCVGHEMVWMKGTVENVDYVAEEADTGRKKRVAYYVKLDYGFEDSYISAEFDICDLIRMAGKEALPPRFAVGDIVECCMGAEFMRGEVIKHHYTETHADGTIVRAPYQVRLLKGGLIYARFDNDMCIRKYYPKSKPK